MPALKHGDSFAIVDSRGDTGTGAGDDGFFHRGTRRLSRFELRLAGMHPILLSSTVDGKDGAIAADLMNPQISADDSALGVVPYATVHVLREQHLWQAVLYGRIRLTNFGKATVGLELSLLFAADFADLFEVRGMKRARRGRAWAEIQPRAVTLGYEGLDGVGRRTHLAFSPQPDGMGADHARFRLVLAPNRPVDLFHTIAFEEPMAATAAAFFDTRASVAEYMAERDCRVKAANPRFQAWLDRSFADLRLLETQTELGPYPHAGVPWFSTIFGRDGIITALECLWFAPDMARGVLRTLAASQATRDDPASHSQPGKILHERREGEMADLGEIPYGHYYGSADATPLFVMLAAAYWRRTGDRSLIAALWPNIERALDWIDRYGDADGDGFVEYGHSGPQTDAERDWTQGLANQGWKDSEDAVMHADGRLADGPIALVEIQAYVHAAKTGAAEMAEALGLPDRAQALRAEAEALRHRFEATFWIEDLGIYALALDGAKSPCRVRASNAGHALWGGIASPERAACLARTLMDGPLFSGWGIRTLAEGEKSYNPMAYHNGAVWPHDTALIAAGLSRYGLTDHARTLLEGLAAAADAIDLHRMPELFCGFPRQSGRGPTRYPVACAPQAWSAASAPFLLQSALGMEITADPPAITFRRPRLPAQFGRVEIAGLAVGEAVVDLALDPGPKGVAITLLKGGADVRLIVEDGTGDAVI